jgi:hypothetical protein
MTTDTEPLKTNKAGAGRRPTGKRKAQYISIFFNEADRAKLEAIKKATGRSLQDIGNTAILEYVDKFGVSNEN